jgi:hypothetical protein
VSAWTQFHIAFSLESRFPVPRVLRPSSSSVLLERIQRPGLLPLRVDAWPLLVFLSCAASSCLHRVSFVPCPSCCRYHTPPAAGVARFLLAGVRPHRSSSSSNRLAQTSHLAFVLVLHIEFKCHHPVPAHHLPSNSSHSPFVTCQHIFSRSSTCSSRGQDSTTLCSTMTR